MLAGMNQSVDVVPALLRRMNVRKVLEAFHLHGPCTRAQLTRRTGISPPTVSTLVAQLAEVGLVEADDKPVMTNGRPGVLYRLATDQAHVLSCVIDVNECGVAVAGLDGRLKEEGADSFETPSDFETLMERLEDCLLGHPCIRQKTCLGIGLTIPGLINRSSGEVIFSPNMHFLDGEAPGARLSKRLGIEAFSLQEEYALCMAAKMFGQARGVPDFAVVDLSQGFGMGVVSADRFVHGHMGYGGEIGHITVERDGKPCGCGNRGCLETVATDRALEVAFSEHLGRKVRLPEVGRMISEDGFDPWGVLQRTIEYVGIGVAAVINIFNPQLVLLHGRMFDLCDEVMERVTEQSLQRALGPSAKGCAIRRTQANKSIGAAAGAIDHLFSRIGPSLGPL